MHKISYRRIFTMALLSCSFSAYSQLVGSDAQLWEKANPTSREATRCKDENLLNFHCGIKDKLLKKYIKYSKNKSHTLSLVHTSKEDELIWKNTDKNVSLSNMAYDNGKEKKEIRKRPSIFSFAGTADIKEKSDSLKIKFEDQNLYEIIFFPRKAKAMDLNKIHSYLSIKYGISLEKGKYYGSDGKVIWDPEKHKDYKYRPTGLGRDDGNELYQKQSSNQADPFLAIGMNDIKRTNVENPTAIDNNNFVIWSDDNKEMSLKTEKDLDILERNWEINFIGNKIPKSDYSVRITKEIVNPRALPLSYWMIIKKDNGEAKKISGVENEKYITFSNVEFLDAFDSGDKSHFTFAVSPKDKTGNGTNPRSDSNLITQNEKDISLDISKIVLYPNPVKKDQNFTIVFPKMENLVISIYDAGGRLVKLEKISENAGSYVNHLPIQSSYLINLTQNGKLIKTFKLIVD
ncbi:T9SS type A sorting domain-containing protein [Chryseobacterium daecheongense]|uniref:Secreted protein (Por secretion system target) n=1 Tax=Chryseobacterium daecheongense TaxID=192389 RepID=A0A3N0VSU7_9FLAO|nr:T9SS type A sorting domain-containing protein [Chryseobacterium daecheongense]ROH95892.1 T9SS C-terminal target domain-containing protein [Chryseobacterium daecheongense]TDX91710.1 putative secreted protein (Por secretion system target) [Chryseobacterium daecheongense]